MIVGALAAGTCIGAASVAALSRAVNRTVEGHDVASVEGGRSCAVLFIGADHRSWIERSVDENTGGLGFSHVVVDACELDETGARLVYDCFPREGVRRVRLSERYGSNRPGEGLRPTVRGVIPNAWAQHVRAGLSALVGQSYDVWTAVLPSRAGLVCSAMVMRVLPPHLTRRVRASSERYPIAPNDLARAYGVASPYSHDVMVSA